MSELDFFDLAEEQLKGFTRSSVRTKIILCLKNDELSGGDLERKIKIRSTTILHTMKELIGAGLAKRTDKGYSLTNIGKVEAQLLIQLVTGIVILNRYKNFWLTHDISGIPPGLLNKLGMLGESEIIESDPASLMKIAEHAMEKMLKAKEIHGLSPIIVPGVAETIATAVQNGAEVDLMLTDAIIKEVVKKHTSLLKELIKHKNFRLYRFDQDVRVAFTVVDSMLSLGLFRLDGGYDLGSDLICTGDNARIWGLELFYDYAKKAELVASESRLNELLIKLI
jgi:predicted transcriptional regulator